MGCCCFNTLKGATFFVASVHIYNGLGLLLQFIAFPIVFTVIQNSNEVQLYEYLPGVIYSIIYLALGIIIFRGIESDSGRMIKWPALGFAFIEIVFFVLRVVLAVIPTPVVPELNKSEQPFQWNIYKTLQYFMFTIVGGIVYLCVLFLYLQQLAGPDSDLIEIICIPSPDGGKDGPTPGGGGGGGANLLTQLAPSSASSKPLSVAVSPPKKPKSHHSTSQKSHKSQGGQSSGSNKVPGSQEPNPMLAPLSPAPAPYYINPKEFQEHHQPHPMNSHSHLGGHPPVPEDSAWHIPTKSHNMMSQQHEPHQPPPSHYMHHPHQQQPPDEPHGFCPPPPINYPPNNHHYQSQEPHYQKIPLSPGFNYCLT